ncbi:ubiquitin conjugating enzyme e2 [Vairimorpha apis BRL 01]|uniref:Ubiquitin conjugating enzyme e2 n=1 Tax=Vairimorpha apis BRL 01 TaxID=1037528 RepID=T0MBR2_9MICR|nr:ubiquitin conjugating enzyme e2 [Vairimorpha apis BRL 01]
MKSGLSPTAAKRLMKEEQMFKDEPKDEILFIAKPRQEGTTKTYKTWDVYFLLKDDNSLYKDKVIEAELVFPGEYPIRPPTLTFITNMWHPNIYTNGKVCISILEEDTPGPIGCGTPEDRWSPVQNIRTVLLSLVILLDNPNPDSPANVDATKVFRNNIEEYKNKVVGLIESEHKKSLKKERVREMLEELKNRK